MNFSYFFLLLYSRGNQQAFKDEWFALQCWVAPWVVRALGSVPRWGAVHVFSPPSGACESPPLPVLASGA